jgi:quinol monooxygenase YgiN
VFAKITPNSDSFEKTKNAIMSIVTQTLNETGCVQFALHQSLDASTLYLYEEWVDQVALDLHLKQPYTLAVISHFSEWVSVPVEVDKMTQNLTA